MARSWWMGGSLLAWVAVWGFWLILTNRYHPTMSLALIVTTSLMVSYASAAYWNHLVLVPSYRRSRNGWQYGIRMGLTMALLTAVALGVIRIAYRMQVGPDADPYGLYKHYAIDLFGMMVHVMGAAAVVAAVSRVAKRTD